MADSSPAPDPDVEPATPPPLPRDLPADPLRRSRTSGAFVAVIALAVLLVLLIVFIAQNTQDVHVSFLTWDGTTPLSVAMLIATVVGILLAAIAGLLRIWQLRRRVRRG